MNATESPRKLLQLSDICLSEEGPTLSPHMFYRPLFPVRPATPLHNLRSPSSNTFLQLYDVFEFNAGMERGWLTQVEDPMYEEAHMIWEDGTRHL